MTQFILTVEGDHAKLTANGLVLYETSIGTKPPTPAPTPTPLPTPAPTPLPSRSVPYHLYQGETREGLEYKFKHGYAKMPEGWSWEEFEASGFMEDFIPANVPAPTNEIRDKHHPYRVELHKGDEHHFSVPTYAGEEVTLTLLEVAGTPDTLQTNSYVTDDRGRLLAGPTYFGRHGSHTFKAQGERSFLSVTPTDSGPIGIQRS